MSVCTHSFNYPERWLRCPSGLGRRQVTVTQGRRRWSTTQLSTWILCKKWLTSEGWREKSKDLSKVGLKWPERLPICPLWLQVITVSFVSQVRPNWMTYLLWLFESKADWCITATVIWLCGIQTWYCFCCICCLNHWDALWVKHLHVCFQTMCSLSHFHYVMQNCLISSLHIK